MIEKYERLFKKYQQRCHSEFPDSLENVPLLYIEADEEDKSEIFCNMDHQGNLFLKSNDYLAVVAVSNILIKKVLNIADMGTYSMKRERDLKAIYDYLSDLLLRNDDDWEIKRNFYNLEQVAHWEGDKAVIDCYIYLVCTTAVMLIKRIKQVS